MAKGETQSAARTATEREREMIGLAMDLAEKKLRNGTASTPIIKHYLDLGATEYGLRMENLSARNELLIAQKESLKKQEESTEIAQRAMEAMKRYSGYSNEYDEG